MSLCSVCGEPIAWYTASDGKPIPRHFNGYCAGNSVGHSGWQRRNPAYEYDGDHDFAQWTKCKYCHKEVFFVRHNGGSVFFVAPGSPWEKHSCPYGPLQTTTDSKTPFAGSLSKRLGVVVRSRVLENKCVVVINFCDSAPQYLLVQSLQPPELGSPVVIDEKNLIQFDGQLFVIAGMADHSLIDGPALRVPIAPNPVVRTNNDSSCRKAECPTCKRRFGTEQSMLQHRRDSHGCHP